MENQNKLTNILNKLIEFGIISLIIFTPLAFGTTQPWSILIFKTIILIMFLSWLSRIFIEKQIVIHKTLLYIPPLLFIFLVLLQLLPLPAAVMKLLSPDTYKIHHSVVSLLDTSQNFTISLNIQSTIEELMKFICYFLVFFLVINQIKTIKQVNLILSIILVLGFFISLFAIIQKFSWTGGIYWFQDVPRFSGPFGPFVNYDHYGGYINMIIPIGLGLMLANVEFSKKILIGFMTVIIATSLLLSRSRGAVLSFVGALFLLVFFIFLARKNFSKRTFISTLISILVILCFIGLFIYWVDWGLFIGRIKTIGLESNFFNPRIAVWKDSFGMVKDFLLTGVGFGNFNHAFPIYQTVYTNRFWRYLHNDYLQHIIEAGPVGILLSFTFLIIFFRCVIKKIRYIRNRYLIGLLVGTTTAVITMLLHSFYDFNLHITSNAFLFTLLLGITYSLSSSLLGERTEVAVGLHPTICHSDPARDGEESHNSIIIPLPPKTSIILPLISSILLIILLLIPSIRYYLSHRYFSNCSGRIHPTDTMSRMRRAVLLSPNNALYHRKLGLLYQEQASSKDINLSEKLSLLVSAKQEFKKAVKLSPVEAKYWSSYGWLLGNLNQNEKALKVFDRALELAPHRENIKELYSKFLKSRKP